MTVSCATLRRFVRRAGLGKAPRSTVRMAEWLPGEVAEMDFGRLGVLVDAAGKRRTVWALVVVLPYSRHCFVWSLCRQTLEEVVAGLEAAWRFFRGVPKRFILESGWRSSPTRSWPTPPSTASPQAPISWSSRAQATGPG